MSWFRCIFQCCCGIRKPHDSSQAQPGSEADRDLDGLTDFIGDMPPYEERDKNDKDKRATYYVNGVRDQGAENRRSDPDCMSDQGTVVETTDTVTREYFGDLQFAGCGNAYPAESGGLMATFVWASDICLDGLELVDFVPNLNSRSGLVEGIFDLNGSQYTVSVPLHYAKRRKRLASNHSKARQIETQFEETNTNHNPRNDLIPTPPSTPINCDDFDAFAAWASGPPPS